MKKLLLDTHVLLWAIGKTDELSAQIIESITNKENEVYVSAVSMWEIALKYSIGKLKLNFDIDNIPEYCKQMGFTLIALEPLEALGSLRLPQKKNHKDPFDRILIFQCIKNDYTLVSKDDRMKLYKKEGLICIW